MNWWEHPELESIKYTTRQGRDFDDEEWKKKAEKILNLREISHETADKLIKKIHPLFRKDKRVVEQ